MTDKSHLLLTKREILATNHFVANETRNISNKFICCTQNRIYVQQNSLFNYVLITAFLLVTDHWRLALNYV